MPKKSDVNVVRLQNPTVFLAAEVQDLFRKAFAANELVHFDDNQTAFMELVADPYAGVFVGQEGGKLLGLGIIMLPATALQKKPRVFHFWCEGSAALRRALQNAGLAYMREAGYTSFWAINATGAQAQVYARLYKGMGKARELGTVVEFDFSESG